MANRARRSRSGLLVGAAGLAALLAALAALQYRWLSQVGEAERLRLRHNARSRADAFARDFNREITRVYLHLQVDPPSFRERSFARYATRYEDWRGRAAQAGLVAAVYLAEPVEGREPRLSRFEPEARTFVPSAWPSSLEAVRGCLDPGGAAPPAEPSSLMPVAEDIPALVAPVPEMVTLGGDDRPGMRSVIRVLTRRDKRPQWPLTIIVLDPAVLGGRLLPGLADRHLAGSAGLDYDYAVASLRWGGAPLYSSPTRPPGPVGEGDASAGLLEVRLDELDVSLISTLLPEGAARRTEQMLAFHLAAPPGRRSGATALDEGPWRLVLTHRAGSIDAVVDRTRRRSLALGLGILGVLAAGVVLILVSSHRARALGARQMDFVAGVSHELRTPLAVIRSAAENLADGVVAEEGAVRRYGAVIRDEGQRLSAMVEQVLAYAAVDRGARLQRRAVSAADVVANVLARAEPALREAGIAVERDIQDGLPPIEGDALALARAVSNLVNNASVHAASGGWIGVRAALGRGPAGPEVLLTVEDRGPGVDPEDLPRLFEPFFRGRRARESQAPGSGLGLAVVLGIVRAHRGRTSVRSTPGGSAFTLHLPADGSPGAQP